VNEDVVCLIVNWFVPTLHRLDLEYVSKTYSGRLDGYGIDCYM
jgi:hypothetical protein